MRSWLAMYGEPDPGKLPTGSMTTFAPSRRRFGKEKSRSSNMSNKVRPRLLCVPPSDPGPTVAALPRRALRNE